MLYGVLKIQGATGHMMLIYRAETLFFYGIGVCGEADALACEAWLPADGSGGDNMNKTGLKTRYLVEAALIAALYAALTIFIPGGSGQIQIRVAEALTVLAFFTPAAIPGLFVGCLTANIFVGAGPYDIVLGSLATLLAAFLTSKMPSKFLAPLPPVIANGIFVAIILKLSINAPLLLTAGFVALGELIACYGLGYPLMLLLEKNRARLFGKHGA
jgi:uncharacterized membrane protein